ncbi:hypothetical protein [Streptomyces sp. x-19]|uniref:hypothetical protein n=1 Tax=Streptomyces sp. x-19 TaxID=2789280 RepID=UPI0039803591
MPYATRFDLTQMSHVDREKPDPISGARSGAVFEIQLPVKPVISLRYVMQKYWVYRICPGIIVYPGPLYLSGEHGFAGVNPDAPKDYLRPSVDPVQQYLDKVADLIDELHRNTEGRELLEQIGRIRPLQPSGLIPPGQTKTILTQEVSTYQGRGNPHWAGFEAADSRTTARAGQAVLVDAAVLMMPQTNAALTSRIAEGNYQRVNSGYVNSYYMAPKEALEGLSRHLTNLRGMAPGSTAVKDEWKAITEIWDPKSAPTERIPRGSVGLIAYNPLLTARGKTVGGPSGMHDIMPLELGLGHELIHALHGLTGCGAGGFRKTVAPYSDSSLMKIYQRLVRPGPDRYFRMSKKEEKTEEIFTGSSIEGRQAALKVLGSRDLVLSTGDRIKVHEEVYSAHRSRMLMQMIAVELRRLNFPDYWLELFQQSSVGGGQVAPGQNSELQLAHHRAAYEQTAWKCEGHLALQTKLQSPCRLTYKFPLTGWVRLDPIIPIGQLSRSHYRLPPGDDGSGQFTIDSGIPGQPPQVRNFSRIWLPHTPSLMPYSVPGRDSSSFRAEEQPKPEDAFDCDLHAEVELEEIDIEDPQLDPLIKTEATLWQQAWKETFEGSEQAGLMTRLGREMTGLPGGRGVWSQAGSVVPGTSVLMKGELGAATGAVHRELTVGGEGKVARLEEFRAKFGPGGEGVTAEMTLAALQAPGLLEDAFRKGTPPLRRAADVLALNPRWFKPATALYVANDIVHGDFKAAGEKVVELGAWLSAFAMLELMGAGPVGWGLVALSMAADVIKQKWAVDAQRKKIEDEVIAWLEKEVKADLGKAPETLWAQAFGDMATALGGEALRLESAAAHDAQVTIATIDNLAALVLQKGAGFAELDKAWWDKLDQEIQAAKWTEDRKTLYNGWLYGSPGAVTDAARRRVYCHLSVCLYRQLRDAAGSSGLKILLDGLDNSPAGLPENYRGETPRTGLENCYKRQLLTVEELAKTVTDIAKSKAQTNNVGNIATWLETAHADFKAGTRRMSQVVGNVASYPQYNNVPPKGTAAYAQWERYGQHIYEDTFVYQPLNPKAADSLSTGQAKAVDRAKQRQGLEFRLPTGFYKDWSVLSGADRPFERLDAALSIPKSSSGYYMFSRESSQGTYREISAREVAAFDSVTGETPFLGSFGGAADFSSSMVDHDWGEWGEALARHLFLKAPHERKFKGAFILKNGSAIVPSPATFEFGEKYFSGLGARRGISLRNVDAMMPDQVKGRFWFFEGNRYVHVEMATSEKCKRRTANTITRDTWPALFGKSPDGIDNDDYDRVDEVIPVPGSRDYYIFKGSSYRLITVPAGGGKSELVYGPLAITWGWREMVPSPLSLVVSLGSVPLNPDAQPQPHFAAYGAGTGRGTKIVFGGMYTQRMTNKGTTDISAATWPSLVAGPSTPSFYAVDAFMPAGTGSDEYFVFSGTHYRLIKLGQDSPIVGSSNIAQFWPSLGQGDPPHFTSVDAVLPVPGVANEYYVFSGDSFRRIRLEGRRDTLVAGPGKINQGVLWPELANAAFTRIDAFMPVEKFEGSSRTYHVFSGDKTVQVGYEPDTTADLIGLHCWSLQEGLLASLTQYLDRQAPTTQQPTEKTPRALKNLEKDRVVAAIRKALKTLWDPGTWSFKDTAFGKPNGEIDRDKVKSELAKYFPESVRTALLTPAFSGELPRQIAQDATDILKATVADQQRLREERAKAAVGRLETALKDWQAAVEDVLEAGATADQHYDDASKEKWDEEEWATARVQEWSDFHAKLSSAWANLKKGGREPEPEPEPEPESGIFAVADRLADPDAGALATALGARLQDTLEHLYRQSIDIRAKKP